MLQVPIGIRASRDSTHFSFLLPPLGQFADIDVQVVVITVIEHIVDDIIDHIPISPGQAAPKAIRDAHGLRHSCTKEIFWNACVLLRLEQALSQVLVGGILLITAIAVLGEAVANDWAVIWRSIREHRTQGLRPLVLANFSIRSMDTGPFCPDLSCQASSHNALAVDLLDDVIQGKKENCRGYPYDRPDACEGKGARPARCGAD